MPDALTKESVRDGFARSITTLPRQKYMIAMADMTCMVVMLEIRYPFAILQILCIIAMPEIPV